MTSNLESNIVAVERVREYTTTDTEVCIVGLMDIDIILIHLILNFKSQYGRVG